MGEQRRNRRNLVQNIIITFLSLLAVLLFTRTQLYSLDLGGGKAPAAGPSQSAAPAAELTAPVRAAVTGDYGRYGSVTLTTGDSGFADLLGRRLLEALGSARDYVSCAPAEFLRALEGPSLYYDFLEPLPLSVLAGLLGGGGGGFPPGGPLRPPPPHRPPGKRNRPLPLGWGGELFPGPYRRFRRQSGAGHRPL